MRIFFALLCALAIAGCVSPVLEESSVAQSLCTDEDQTSGNCPETAWLVALAISRAEAQYGPAESTWWTCVYAYGGWTCRTHIDWWWGYVETTCFSDGRCEQTDGPN